MAKKVFIFIAGSLLLAPCLLAICCDSILFMVLAMVYGVVLWNSPKFCKPARKFWREFWRFNLVVQKMLEP